MSLSLDPSIRNLGSCNCCTGLTAETPVVAANRPGLTAIAYRAGTHSQFKDTLLARLSTFGEPALDALTTRDDDDFSIALLDAFAAVCDVLTFYQERIANESYLRTGRELRSLVELARLVGYQIQPGVAASVDLAFTLEDAPGALGQALGVGTTAQVVPSPPLRLVIDAKTKVQSVPGPGEQALTFETIQQIEARAEWNAVKPRSRQPQTLSAAADTVMLAGIATNLKPGDTILILDGALNRFRRVLQVTPDNDAKVTRVDLKLPSAFPPAYVRPAALPKGTIDALSPKTTPTDAVVIAQIAGKTWDEEDLAALIRVQGWDEQMLIANIARQTKGQPPNATGTGVFAFRQRAAIFGHNAPLWKSLSSNLRFGEIAKDQTGASIPVPPAFPSDWDTNDPGAIRNTNQIFLDNTYPAITAGSYIALVAPSGSPGNPAVQICRVQENIEQTISDFAISAKVSCLTVSFVMPVTPASQFKMRATTVLAASEELPTADIPIDDAIQGDTITLDGTFLGLKAGQTVVLTGERTDLQSTMASESKTIKDVIVEAGFTVLTFQKGLTYTYRRSTATLNANVAPATHGESVAEVLGSGDGGRSFQTFTLRQPPLTYVTSPSPSGAESTLEIRVDDLLWKEVPTLFGHDSAEHIYITRADAAGNTTVEFGDSRTGARPATGTENIRAAYRKGIGKAGVLPANRLTQVLTRPLGLKAVTNPLPSAGGADAEKLEDVRRNAPLPIRTLGRIVSLQDYEDFARAFAGVAKALGTWTWNGNVRAVFVTIAGVDGADIPKDGNLYKNLLNAIMAAGDPTVPLTVEPFVPRVFRLSGTLQIDPAYIPAKVVAAVTDKLRRQFAFDARELGQAVALSEVIAVIQAVKGVVAVDMDELYRSDTAPGLQNALPVSAPRPGAETGFGAELLTLDPRPIKLEVAS